jgi:phenylacetate-CoA ligase
MINIRGVNVFPSQIEELLLRIPGVAPHYQLELTSKGQMDWLNVHIEAIRPNAGEELARSVKENIGISVSVEIHEPGSMERATGKSVRVIDRRG